MPGIDIPLERDNSSTARSDQLCATILTLGVNWTLTVRKTYSGHILNDIHFAEDVLQATRFGPAAWTVFGIEFGGFCSGYLGSKSAKSP